MMNRLALAALAPLPLLAACGLGLGPLGPDAASVSRVDGIEYRAEVLLEREGRATTGPAMIRPTVTLKNTTREPVEVRLDGCAVRLDIHRDAARTGPPAWSTERPGAHCMQAPYTLRLGPGRSERIQDAFDGGLVLGSLGQPGRYHFTIRLRTLAGETVLPAGSADLGFGADQLAYRGETRLEGTAPTRLLTEVTVTNTGRQRVRIEYGACSIWLRAYRTADRSGPPAWDQIRHPRIGAHRPCAMYLAVRELGRGESFSPNEFRTAIPVPEILGDSLPAGRYHLVARVHLNGFAVDVPAGEAELPAQ
jgi:hypothetical protein